LKIDISYFLGALITLFLVIKTPVTSYLHLPSSPSETRFVASHLYKSVSSIIQDDDKVYIIYDGDKTRGYTFYITRYLFNPVQTNNYGWLITADDEFSEKYSVHFSASSWLDFLNDQEYTYVFVVTSENSFWDSYGTLFDTYSKDVTFDGYIMPQLFKVTPDGLINVPITVNYYE